jgi:hypothetical protein
MGWPGPGSAFLLYHVYPVGRQDYPTSTDAREKLNAKKEKLGLLAPGYTPFVVPPLPGINARQIESINIAHAEVVTKGHLALFCYI